MDLAIEALKLGGVPALAIVALVLVVRAFLAQLRSMTDSREAESDRFRAFVAERDQEMKGMSERCHSSQDSATAAIRACALQSGENISVMREVVAAVGDSRLTQQELLAFLRMQNGGPRVD